MKSMTDKEARELIEFIRRRTRGIPGSEYMDYFHHSPTVCELVESTLIGLDYDPDWVCGQFSDMLEAAVEKHRHNVVFGNRQADQADQGGKQNFPRGKILRTLMRRV